MQYNTALITGASSGLGAEFARLHAQNGGRIILTARTESALRNLAAELESQHQTEIAVLTADLSLPNGPQDLFLKILDLGWEIDWLINNAGFGDLAPFVEAADVKLHQMMAVNIVALTTLTKLLVPQMVARKRGAILNIGSVASYFPGPGMAVYYASKAYVLSFSEALAEELAPYNIHVSTLCPGPTETGFQKTANMDMQTVMGGLFANMPSAATVARYGYEGVLKKKRVRIHGLMNQWMIASTKILPTTWKAAIMGRIQMQRMGR